MLSIVVLKVPIRTQTGCTRAFIITGADDADDGASSRSVRVVGSGGMDARPVNIDDPSLAW